MTSLSLSSSMAQEITNFITFKRMEGFAYTSQAKSLARFDAFLCEQRFCQTTLNQQIIDAYITQTVNRTPNSRYSTLSIVRVFSRHLNRIYPESYVLHDLPCNRASLPRWYLYSSEDIAALLRHAKTLGPAGSLRPHCFHTLVGLLYVTGLRISEALALNLGDLDPSSRLLFVRKGKLDKKRYVVLHPTAMRAIEEYLVKRNAFEPSGDSSPLFLSRSGKRLDYDLAAKTFRRMTRLCKIGPDSPKPPRLHDLRHSYACNCVFRWYQEGADVNSKLPILATSMGHVNVESSQIYLHVTSRLLKQAAQRFQGTFTASCKGENS